MSVFAEQDEQVIKAALDTLREHFDSVQIFVTRYESGKGTQSRTRGAGNYYANLGSIREYLLAEDAVTKHNALPKPE